MNSFAAVRTLSLSTLSACMAFGGEQANADPVVPTPGLSAVVAGPAPTGSPCPAEVPHVFAADPRSMSKRLIVVYKNDFQGGFYSDGKLAHDAAGPMCFPIALGQHPQGPKTRQDNASTPEGWYHIAEKRDVGHTAFYRGLLVSYPNEVDADRALAQGVITRATHDTIVAATRAGRLPSQNTAMGGTILVHGMGATPNNWTWGCVGAENETMDALFPLVRVGDPILIVPWE